MLMSGEDEEEGEGEGEVEGVGRGGGSVGGDVIGGEGAALRRQLQAGSYIRPLSSST